MISMTHSSKSFVACLEKVLKIRLAGPFFRLGLCPNDSSDLMSSRLADNDGLTKQLSSFPMHSAFSLQVLL